MQKWEYARLIYDNQKLLCGWIVYLNEPMDDGRYPPNSKTTIPVNALMTKLGLEGWELVAIEPPSNAIYRNYIFKRLIEE
jgi:hypothetical protein